MRRRVLPCWLSTIVALGACSLDAGTHEPAETPHAIAGGGAGMAAEESPVEEPTPEAPEAEPERDGVGPLDGRGVAQGQLDELQDGACAGGCAVAGQGHE